MANKISYNLKGTSFGLNVTKEMVPKGRAEKLFDRIFNKALGDERVKLTLGLYSNILDGYQATGSVELDTTKSGDIANIASNSHVLYHAASRLVGNFKNGLKIKDARQVYKSQDYLGRNREDFATEALIREVLENETKIVAKHDYSTEG